MKSARAIFLALVAATAAATAPLCHARHPGDALMNRPYADSRPWHLGFSVGLNMMDIRFTHNGFTTDDGRQWFMAQPDYSPGFNVGGLASLRLSRYFSLRLTPGLCFGSRSIRFREDATGQTERQDTKTTLVVVPLDLKFASQRYRNTRPYLTAGAMAAFDVSKKSSEYLRFRPADCYLTVGLGCDFYLPYFKLNPELKFCIGLADIIEHHRPDLDEQPSVAVMTQSLTKATSRMVVLTFYFE